MPNSPQLILAAKTELIRLGCSLTGKPDGVMNHETKAALVRFMTTRATLCGRPHRDASAGRRSDR